MQTFISTNELSEVFLLAESINNALADELDESLVSFTFLVDISDSNGENMGYLVNDPNDPRRVVFSATPEIE